MNPLPYPIRSCTHLLVSTQPGVACRLRCRAQVNLVDSREDVLAACAEGLTVLAEAGESGCSVGVSRAGGAKCERCWYHCESVGTHSDHPTLCTRCDDVVEALGIPPPPPTGGIVEEEESGLAGDVGEAVAAVAGAGAAS